MYDIEIHVKGKIDPSLSDWFGELQLSENSHEETVLRGELPDISAVYGVISRLGSLVLPMVSVCIEEADKDRTRVANEHPVHLDS